MIRIFKLHLENFNLKIYCNFVFEYGCFFPFANNALLQLQIELPLCSFGQVIEEGRAVCGFDWPDRQAYCLNKPCLLQLSSEESMCCYHLLPVCNVRNRDNWHSNVMSKEWLRHSPLHLIVVFVYYSEIPEDLNLGLYFLKFYPN